MKMVVFLTVIENRSDFEHFHPYSSIHKYRDFRIFLLVKTRPHASNTSGCTLEFRYFSEANVSLEYNFTEFS